MKARTPRDNRAGASRVLLVVGIGLTLGAVVLGIAVAYAVTNKPPAAPQEGAAAEAVEAAPGPQGEWVYVPFGSTVVNLAGGRLTRYLQVTINLKVKKESAEVVQAQIEEAQNAVLKNWLLVHLSDKRIEEVEGGASIKRLQREIEDGFNAILFESCGCKVDEVLFEEFNIQ